MTELPPVGALWIGGSLTWLEQLCLTSFLRKGHPTILYTYGEVKGVPEGVELRDGRGVIDTDAFIRHGRTESVALFSDKFRFHMIARDPSIIYVDTDIYCHRPIDCDDRFLFGYETYDGPPNGIINGAVLRLPGESETLHRMLAFMEDEYAIPHFLPPRLRQPIEARAAAGDPVHVSEMPWGIWGPLGVTGFLRETGEAEHARLRDVFYPVHFKERRVFFKRPMKTFSQLTDDTRTIHLWAPIKRFAASRFDGVPPDGSFLDFLLKEHDIDAHAAPVPRTEKREVVE
ncbi:MAG: hypothetical protein ACPGID_08440 [Rubricella sp.]